MNKIFIYIKGDKTIWSVVAILSVFSFLPIYSASSNLVYAVGTLSAFGYLKKHILFLISGFIIIFLVHKIPYKYFSGGSVLMIPVIIILLLVTLFQGTTIAGSNASRWIKGVPIIGSFQPSTLAGVVLMTFTARYLARNKNNKIKFKDSFFYYWLPVGFVLALILPSNFSTTAIIFLMILFLMFVGGYSLKYIFYIFTIAITCIAFFILTIKAFPNLMPNRINTWSNRIKNFAKNDDSEIYQVEKAKIAIASGVGKGLGFGKSIQRNFLPQSSSDFIYAIIIEETGILGGMFVIFFYFLLLFRIVMIAKKANTIFATLLVIGVGIPIIFQAIVNMSVATNLLPVTGQTLPLISSGGTSIWMTCFSLGMVLSVSASKNETEETILDDNPLDILSESKS